MVLIELYGRAVWGAVWGSCMGELYGGAVYWSCMLKILDMYFIFSLGDKPVPLLYDLGPRNMPYSRGLTSINN